MTYQKTKRQIDRWTDHQIYLLIERQGGQEKGQRRSEKRNEQGRIQGSLSRVRVGRGSKLGGHLGTLAWHGMAGAARRHQKCDTGRLKDRWTGLKMA